MPCARIERRRGTGLAPKHKDTTPARSRKRWRLSFSAGYLRLKVVLQPELDNPLIRIVPIIARAGDFARLGVISRVDIWIIELRAVEKVEEFGAKLQIVSFP